MGKRKANDASFSSIIRNKLHPSSVPTSDVSLIDFNCSLALDRLAGELGTTHSDGVVAIGQNLDCTPMASPSSPF